MGTTRPKCCPNISSKDSHRLTHRCNFVVHSEDMGLRKVVTSDYCANGEKSHDPVPRKQQRPGDDKTR